MRRAPGWSRCGYGAWSYKPLQLRLELVGLGGHIEVGAPDERGLQGLDGRVRLEEVRHVGFVAGDVRVGQHVERDLPVDLVRREALVERLEERGLLALDGRQRAVAGDERVVAQQVRT